MTTATEWNYPENKAGGRDQWNFCHCRHLDEESKTKVKQKAWGYNLVD